MEALLEWVRRLLGLEKDADQIMRPLTKIMTDLERREQCQIERAAKADEQARRLADDATAKRAEAARAHQRKAKVAELIGD